ncbi:uncharacterized protein BP01DRAFT_368726 [Aspergillus saccharolyticus JOP 1030-1]|uniref:Uncharacterized protein n=1 Tax=Aspergillus saccharolyticus JOP 1030-1 TaxID=1450539 RepID=A0A318ZAV4_9EURO|nr:hypothetical protein BP01DRAFT_368726 [Aspergillus saccharolyticus JOP 1030-1]PYH41843.1 hypothetical protein BP01DRAFT_368726 [Aspergillus saccharolyticus JOP 1030-1]
MKENVAGQTKEEKDKKDGDGTEGRTDFPGILPPPAGGAAEAISPPITVCLFQENSVATDILIHRSLGFYDTREMAVNKSYLAPLRLVDIVDRPRKDSRMINLMQQSCGTKTMQCIKTTSSKETTVNTSRSKGVFKPTQKKGIDSRLVGYCHNQTRSGHIQGKFQSVAAIAVLSSGGRGKAELGIRK